MPTFDESFAAIEAALVERYGEPAVFDGIHLEPFAAIVAAALGRSTDARKVGRALDALGTAGLLEPQALAEADPAEVTEALRPTGISGTDKKLGPIRRLARWLVDRHHGQAEDLRDRHASTAQLREELGELNGIGPATADAILLQALDRPAYPVDRATFRILVRHAWLDPTAEYDEARSLVERSGRDDPAVLRRLSEAMERVGREFCRASAARCENCPLRPFLPEGGPREPDAFY